MVHGRFGRNGVTKAVVGHSRTAQGLGDFLHVTKVRCAQRSGSEGLLTVGGCVRLLNKGPAPMLEDRDGKRLQLLLCVVITGATPRICHDSCNVHVTCLVRNALCDKQSRTQWCIEQKRRKRGTTYQSSIITIINHYNRHLSSSINQQSSPHPITQSSILNHQMHQSSQP